MLERVITPLLSHSIPIFIYCSSTILLTLRIERESINTCSSTILLTLRRRVVEIDISVIFWLCLCSCPLRTQTWLPNVSKHVAWLRRMCFCKNSLCSHVCMGTNMYDHSQVRCTRNTNKRTWSANNTNIRRIQEIPKIPKLPCAREH